MFIPSPDPSSLALNQLKQIKFPDLFCQPLQIANDVCVVGYIGSGTPLVFSGWVGGR